MPGKAPKASGTGCPSGCPSRNKGGGLLDELARLQGGYISDLRLECPIGKLRQRLHQLPGQNSDAEWTKAVLYLTNGRVRVRNQQQALSFLEGDSS